MMDIGKTIKVLRTAAGVSQKDFARALGISGSYLSLIESNEREPSFSLVRRMSRELGVPIGVMSFQGGAPEEDLTLPEREERRQAQVWMQQALERMLSLGKTGRAATGLPQEVPFGGIREGHPDD